MKPARFEYHRATHLDHACELISAFGDDGKVLAGGQSLIAAMNFRLARPKVLVDISNVEDSNRISDEREGVRIAATTTQRHAERDDTVRRRLPVLANGIEHIAHFQIRNKGTVGGSIVNADPASELPALSLLLDADFEIRNGAGQDTVQAEDFFITYMTTSLQDGDLLASILFREPPANSGWGLNEVARRPGDFAIAGSAAVVGLDAQQRCDYARVVLFGVAATPVRAREVEQCLMGEPCSPELFREAARQVSEVVDAESDVHASARYRERTAEVLTARALGDACARARTRLQGGH